MSAQRWPDHDWQADEYTLIRGPYAAEVRRAWCSYDSASDPWSWVVFRTDVGSCAPISPEEGRHGFTREEATAAAEAFIAEREREEQGLRWSRFEGVTLPEDCEAF